MTHHPPQPISPSKDWRDWGHFRRQIYRCISPVEDVKEAILLLDACWIASPGVSSKLKIANGLFHFHTSHHGVLTMFIEEHAISKI